MTEINETKEEIKKLVVFVASERDQAGNYSPVLDMVEQTSGVILLHNQYDYANVKGREVLSNFETAPPTDPHPWEQSLRQDFWGIQEADIVVLDLDSLNSVHFMAVAALYHKPMVAVSSTLISVPAYFSGSVDLIVKPGEVLNSISYALTRREERWLAAEAETKAKLEDDAKFKASLSDANTSTKVKMQDILQRSLQKTLSKMDLPVEGSVN